MKNNPILVKRLPRGLRQSQNVAGSLALALVGGTLIALSAASSAATKVAMKLQGDIEPACAISGNFASRMVMGLTDITKPGRKDYGFTVNCNAPFDYRLEAQHGALTHENVVAPAGFTASVPYEVLMHIPTDGIPIHDRCSGESIRAGHVRCPFSNSGGGIALGSVGQLTLAWAPGNAVPVAGQYSDYIKVIVAARQ